MKSWFVQSWREAEGTIHISFVTIFMMLGLRNLHVASAVAIKRCQHPRFAVAASANQNIAGLNRRWASTKGEIVYTVTDEGK